MQTEQPKQKITAHLPKDLLADALKVTDVGITETVRLGLEELVRKQAYNTLRKARGTFKNFDVDHLSISANKYQTHRPQYL